MNHCACVCWGSHWPWSFPHQNNTNFVLLGCLVFVLPQLKWTTLSCLRPKTVQVKNRTMYWLEIFGYTEKKSVRECFSVLNEVYGRDARSCARIFEWPERFSKGRVQLEDNWHLGQPHLTSAYFKKWKVCCREWRHEQKGSVFLSWWRKWRWKLKRYWKLWQQMTWCTVLSKVK